ncbi:MAG: HAMP domain-containing sensor histidine kinase [Clostridium sp.]|nr:HAMP domain-containing sensor histidine kinase [Clostridium sp.]
MNINIEELKKIKHFEFIVFLVLSLILIDKLQFFMFLSYIITGSIVVVLFYTNFIRVNFVHRVLFKDIILVNINIISVLILNITGLFMLFCDVKIIYYFFIYSLQCILDFSQIQIILNLYKKPIGLYIHHILCAAILISVGVISSLVRKNVIAICFFEAIIIITLIISFGIMAKGAKIIIGAKNNFCYKQYRRLKIYVICTVCSLMSFSFIAFKLTNITIVCLVLKYLSHIELYNFLLHKNLNDSLDLINMDIKKASVEKINLNRILNKRNFILCEKNKMIMKSRFKYRNMIDSIYDGIFVFKNDKLSYSNNILDAFYSESESINEISIDLFFERYLNLDINTYSVSDDEHIRSFPIIKRNKGSYEVNLICDESSEKIVYIHDVTQINENIKIKRQLEKCKEDDERKKEFFSNISHELKTPINLIYSAIQLNTLYLKENNLELFERNRMIIKKNCLRLIRTINNFIDANKISEGYITPEIRIYNIVELVESIAIGCNKYAEKAGINLIFDADEEEIFIKCDRDMIHRIILNIISNFVKYNEGVTFIKVHVCLKEDKVFIKIKSDGKKIDKDIIPFIFDKFTKINKAFNRLKEGSGLGLFLVKALVELQKGEIRLSSKCKGNEFSIIFDRIENISYEEILNEFSEMNALEEKIDIEFSDIYIE